MRQALAYTADLAHDDENKYLVGTPAEVQKTMLRVWKEYPTSERIVQDILRWPSNIEAIIAAKGAKVEELDNRSGRRRTKKARDFRPTPIPEVEELLQAKYARLDDGEDDDDE